MTPISASIATSNVCSFVFPVNLKCLLTARDQTPIFLYANVAELLLQHLFGLG